MNKYPNAGKGVYVVTTNWNENTVTWDVGAPWNSGGGDYEVTPAANYNTSLEVWEDYDVTEAVKSFLRNEKQNNGFILKLTEEGVDGGVTYISSEYIRDFKLRPKLTITLDLPSKMEPIDNVFYKEKFTIKKSDNSYSIHLLEKGNISLCVYNLQGKLVSSIVKQNKKIIKIPITTSGCYVLKIVINSKIFKSRLVSNISN